MRTSLELQPSALALAIADVVAASVRDRLGGDRQIENEEGPAPIGMDKQAEGCATAAPSAMNIDLIIDQWKRNDRPLDWALLVLFDLLIYIIHILIRTR
jgi:hypothetical protein